MSRGLSASLNTQLANDNNTFAFLVQLSLSSTYRITDHTFDVTYNANTYTASGELVSVSTTPETGELRAEETTIQLTNVSSTFRSEFQNEQYIDNEVKIYLGFFDSNDSFIDAFTFFSGNIKTVEITENKDSSVINVSVGNHWSNWNLTKGRHYTDESQQKEYSGDKGLEFAHVTKADIRWGS